MELPRADASWLALGPSRIHNAFYDHATKQHGLLLVRGGDLRWHPWQGRTRLEVAADRRCIGRIIEGQHVACPDNALVTAYEQCPRCQEIEAPECIFEPKCRGRISDCICPWAQVEHVVYLALYGTLPKVGMTKRSRVETRLTEQGADAFQVLATFEHRALAREFEQNVSQVFKGKGGIPEFRTHRQLFPLWTKARDEVALTESAERTVQRLRVLPVSPEPLQILPHQDAPHPLPAMPDRAQGPGIHQGLLRGGRGNYLFYEVAARPGTLDVGLPRLHGIKRHDLIGRDVVVATKEEG